MEHRPVERRLELVSDEVETKLKVKISVKAGWELWFSVKARFRVRAWVMKHMAVDERGRCGLG